jgi:hypothetical protein
MKDMRAHLEMHRTQIAECETLQAAAKSKIKCDIFKKAGRSLQSSGRRVSERSRNPKNPKGKASVPNLN